MTSALALLQDADDNVVLGPVGGRLEVGRPAGMTAGQEQRVVIVLRGPFPVAATGVFRWVPVLDGKPAQATRFRVDRVGPPTAGSPPFP